MRTLLEMSLTGEDHAVLSHPHDGPQQLMLEGPVLSCRTLLLRQKHRLTVNGEVNFRQANNDAVQESPFNQLNGPVKLTGLWLVIKLGP